MYQNSYNVVMAKTAPISIRIEDSTDKLLRDIAKREQRSRSAIAARLLEERARMHRFPGIDFRDRAAGRRAYLSGTRLDVWHIALYLNGGMSSEDIAKHLNIDLSKIETAKAYYEHYPEEVDYQIELNSDIEGIREEFPGLTISESKI